jgi:RNA polymerase sigma-70 factor (ECF subfamily)
MHFEYRKRKNRKKIINIRQNGSFKLSLLTNRRWDNVLDKKLPDNMLRAALARNDPAALELMWDRYASDLFAYLLAVLCSRHDAEDVLQTVFVKIAQKRHRLAKARHLDAYIYRIARNEAFSFIGRRKKDRTIKALDESWLIVPESHKEKNDLAEQLQAVLALLPQQQREVIVMKIYKQKTFLEISRTLGLSQHTVASRYRYGMEKLRILLGDILS